MKRLGLVFFVVLTLLLPAKSYAATLTTVSDTISTSRPSPSSPLTTNALSGESTIAIVNNGSRFLASDSAKIISTSNNAIVNNGLIVASQSSALTSVFTANTLSSNSGAGADVLIAPMTAMHTVQFTTVSSIPVSGSILLTFPTLTSGDANNPSSPSATTFQLNNIGSGQFKAFSGSTDITSNITLVATNPSAGTPPTISLTLDGSTSINTGTVVKIFLGCSTGTSSSCTTQTQRLINPTKTATAGTADRWKLIIQTYNASSTLLDSGSATIGTIDSVQVLGTVDPSLTFTITGLANGVAWSTGNAGCSATEVTNSGISATSTVVNLGLLNNTPNSTNTTVSNISGQRVNITTNAAGGYALTATSSGQFMDTSSGYAIASSTTPTAFPNDDPWFGVHPCGVDVTTATWNSSASQTCNTYITGSTNPVCLYAWPTTTTALTLASDSTGPIGVNAASDGNGIVSLAYAAGVDPGVPAGIYQSIITYIATATF